MTEFHRDAFRLANQDLPDRFKVRQAINHLKAAREMLDMAGAPRAVEKVRAALKSAEGAERHAIGRSTREG